MATLGWHQFLLLFAFLLCSSSLALRDSAAPYFALCFAANVANMSSAPSYYRCLNVSSSNMASRTKILEQVVSTAPRLDLRNPRAPFLHADPFVPYPRHVCFHLDYPVCYDIYSNVPRNVSANTGKDVFTTGIRVGYPGSSLTEPLVASAYMDFLPALVYPSLSYANGTNIQTPTPLSFYPNVNDLEFNPTTTETALSPQLGIFCVGYQYTVNNEVWVDCIHRNGTISYSGHQLSYGSMSHIAMAVTYDGRYLHNVASSYGFQVRHIAVDLTLPRTSSGVLVRTTYGIPSLPSMNVECDSNSLYCCMSTGNRINGGQTANNGSAFLYCVRSDIANTSTVTNIVPVDTSVRALSSVFAFDSSNSRGSNFVCAAFSFLDSTRFLCAFPDPNATNRIFLDYVSMAIYGGLYAAIDISYDGLYFCYIADYFTGYVTMCHSTADGTTSHISLLNTTVASRRKMLSMSMGPNNIFCYTHIAPEGLEIRCNNVFQDNLVVVFSEASEGFTNSQSDYAFIELFPIDIGINPSPLPPLVFSPTSAASSSPTSPTSAFNQSPTQSSSTPEPTTAPTPTPTPTPSSPSSVLSTSTPTPTPAASTAQTPGTSTAPTSSPIPTPNPIPTATSTPTPLPTTSSTNTPSPLSSSSPPIPNPSSNPTQIPISTAFSTSSSSNLVPSSTPSDLGPSSISPFTSTSISLVSSSDIPSILSSISPSQISSSLANCLNAISQLPNATCEPDGAIFVPFINLNFSQTIVLSNQIINTGSVFIINNSTLNINSSLINASGSLHVSLGSVLLIPSYNQPITISGDLELKGTFSLGVKPSSRLLPAPLNVSGCVRLDGDLVITIPNDVSLKELENKEIKIVEYSGCLEGEFKSIKVVFDTGDPCVTVDGRVQEKAKSIVVIFKLDYCFENNSNYYYSYAWLIVSLFSVLKRIM